MRGNGKTQYKIRMKKNSYFLVLLFAASVIFTGCRSNDDPESEYIVIDDGTVNQNVYADEVTGESGIRFTTLAPWTSSVTEDWVSINPASGGVGTHNITISLTPNFTGADRSAIITITSGGTTIEIRITQQRVTEGGEVPKEPFVIVAENVEGDTDEIVTVRAMISDWNWENYFTAGEAPFQNNGFTLQLNDVPESHLPFSVDEFFPSNLVSDRNAKMAALGGDLGLLVAFDSNGDAIGGFYLIDEYEEYQTFWIYVDRDVTIRGTYDYFSIDLDLRRGWTIVYEYRYEYDYNTKWHLTTQKPVGANLHWYFWSWDFEDWSSRSATTRTTDNKRSIFRR